MTLCRFLKEKGLYYLKMNKMKHEKKNLDQIIEYIEGTGLKVCIIGKNFISLGVKDMRCQRGWRVKTIFKHNIKNFSPEFLAKHGMEKIIFSLAKI